MKASFKKAMNGLSAQYAGEHLSGVNKIRVLNERPVTARKSSKQGDSSGQLNSFKSGKAHIALLCDDATNQHVLDYVLDNSSDCQVDILYHGTPNNSQSESFYKRAKKCFVENNIDIRLVKLISDSISEIKEYLTSQGSLQYLITDSRDNLINDFLNNKQYKGQVNVPIVLIN